MAALQLQDGTPPLLLVPPSPGATQPAARSAPVTGQQVRPQGNNNQGTPLARGGSWGAKAASGAGGPARALYPEYWDNKQLQKALKLSHVFRCKLRVNARNPKEGYCTVDGLPNDVLLR